MFTKRIINDYFADKPSKLRHSTGGLCSFCLELHFKTLAEVPKDIFIQGDFIFRDLTRVGNRVQKYLKKHVNNTN